MAMRTKDMCSVCATAEHCTHHGRCLAECRPADLAAAPVGEPAAMPPVEVGDWVEDRAMADCSVVRAPHHVEFWNKNTDIITEIRKASGVIWRRTDRKEPTK